MLVGLDTQDQQQSHVHPTGLQQLSINKIDKLIFNNFEQSSGMMTVKNTPVSGQRGISNQ